MKRINKNIPDRIIVLPKENIQFLDGGYSYDYDDSTWNRKQKSYTLNYVEDAEYQYILLSMVNFVRSVCFQSIKKRITNQEISF